MEKQKTIRMGWEIALEDFDKAMQIAYSKMVKFSLPNSEMVRDYKIHDASDTLAVLNDARDRLVTLEHQGVKDADIALRIVLHTSLRFVGYLLLQKPIC